MLIGLQKVYSKLAHSGEIFFYFVVPAQLYNSYKKQNFVTTNNVIAQRMPAWIKNRVKQYALKNDLSTGGLLDRTSSTATIEKQFLTLSTAGESEAGPSTLSIAGESEAGSSTNIPKKRGRPPGKGNKGKKKIVKPRGKPGF